MRLIDADALPQGRVEWEDIVGATTVEAVEVTRCNECRFGYPRGGWTYNEYRCHKFPSDIFSGDHFCAWGEPRPEEDE